MPIKKDKTTKKGMPIKQEDKMVGMPTKKKKPMKILLSDKDRKRIENCLRLIEEYDYTWAEVKELIGEHKKAMVRQQNAEMRMRYLKEKLINVLWMCGGIAMDR